MPRRNPGGAFLARTAEPYPCKPGLKYATLKLPNYYSQFGVPFCRNSLILPLFQAILPHPASTSFSDRRQLFAIWGSLFPDRRSAAIRNLEFLFGANPCRHTTSPAFAIWGSLHSQFGVPFCC